MACKTLNITIEDNNRDKGKKFLITEWPAQTADNWGNRLILAAGRAGSQIDHIIGTGMAGVFLLGFQALMRMEENTALALIDELLTCVQIVEPALTRSVTRDDIEEVRTLWHLRKEVFALHVGFSWAEIQQALISAMESMGSSIIQTSQESSGKSSPRAKPRSRNSRRS